MPGDDKLVFLSNRDSDYLKLWTVSLTSGKEEPLLDLGAGVEYAMVSPDGNQAAYNFIQKGIMNVWVADLRNGQRKQLTFDTEMAGFPCWSPDGQWIAFEVKRGEADYLMLIPSKGMEQIQLTFDKGRSWPHSFSPSGDKIVFGGLKESNAYEFGLALHYMTDLTQPMHTSGFDAFKIPNNLHPQYEYYVAFVQGNWPATDMSWNERWRDRDPDGVLLETALKSNDFAPSLSKALNIDGLAGIVTIQGFNGVGPYTGFNFYHDKKVDALTGEILKDAYQSTASFLYSVYKKTSQ